MTYYYPKHCFGDELVIPIIPCLTTIHEAGENTKVCDHNTYHHSVNCIIAVTHIKSQEYSRLTVD